MEVEKFIEIEKPEEIIRAEQLIDDEKLDEALSLLNNFLQKEGLTHHDKASCHLLQVKILYWQGKYKKLLKRTEQAYKESERLENKFLKIDSLIWMVSAFLLLGKSDETFDLIKQADEMMKAIPQKLTNFYKQRESSLSVRKGYYYRIIQKENDIDLPLKYFKHGLMLQEELEGNKHEIARILYAIAFHLSFDEGELNLALNYAKRSLALSKESNKSYYIANSLYYLSVIYGLQGKIERSTRLLEQSIELFKKLNNKPKLADAFNDLSGIYMQKGDLNKALEYIEESMALNHDLGYQFTLANNYDFLIQILIEKGDFKQAQISLHGMKQLKDRLKNRYIDSFYLIDKALLLKTSLRAPDRVKAEKILKQVLKNENLAFEAMYTASLNLCDLLLTELRITNDVELLDEIQKFIGKSLELAEKSNSHWVLGETYLLRAKLALISLDLKEARRLLTQGQQIAERYGIKSLSIKISNEHDEVMRQLNMWENLKETTYSLKDRMELARLDEQMKSMIYKRVSEVLEVTSEEPILLLIASEGGKPIFSKLFKEEFSFQDHLWSGFLSAFNSFSDEMLSEGLDRVKFGDYILIIKAVPPFLVYYLFKGQTYLAQSTIQSFIKKMQGIDTIWQNFNQCYQLHQEVQLKDIPSLEELLTETFSPT
ncbi:MAG: tetratricopeptide repeat protein [Promethearchaeota archaeon]